MEVTLVSIKTVQKCFFTYSTGNKMWDVHLMENAQFLEDGLWKLTKCGPLDLDIIL
jgi:hypothetical protein